MSEPKHYRELEQQLDTVTSSINELDPIPFPESDLISFDDPTTASASDPESAQKRRAEEAPWKKKKKKRSLARELLSFVATIAFVVCLTAAFKLFVIDIYSVPTGSMSPTISVDDRIIAEKVSRYFSPIQAGDIITFTDPIREGRILVKRVIAVGGQTVDLIDGVVYVNNKALVEPYTLGRPSLPLRTANGVTIEYPYRIPEGQIWVMGDNRTDSLDSRYFGTIDERSVSGRSILVLWPFEHFGTFD
ncbi:MAG: signal peptidase I [Coriobacteriales bacterium]|nr:signal peptidase I [Coriobacteriales bacterium]